MSLNGGLREELGKRFLLGEDYSKAENSKFDYNSCQWYGLQELEQ